MILIRLCVTCSSISPQLARLRETFYWVAQLVFAPISTRLKLQARDFASSGIASHKYNRLPGGPAVVFTLIFVVFSMGLGILFAARIRIVAYFFFYPQMIGTSPESSILYPTSCRINQRLGASGSED